MAGKLNLVKLCVGVSSVAELQAWRDRKRAEARARGEEYFTRHVTRMWPRRAGEILGGGSLYWVIGGVIRVRQRVLRFDERIGADGIRRCAIVMDPELIRTEAQPRRAFQGWRYLEARDAPRDLARTGADRSIPAELQEELARIGVR
ncbi:MAG: DUF1489 family protein [Paracoccaceae bacterium]